ncbi:Gamma tubulin complex component C-terminal [Phytophthora infestans]|uniref:Spindle pole body component n=1 Tax=Phytophthora infestans TaxID=4787 RepID=A0A833WF44_PHYIN|nr:Gamma tubulin complex component C-terminal [Phytophthora infestans]
MHHELFLALLGHTGDVVERRADGFFVRKEASFLSQAQHSILNRLLRLGFAFSTLDQFVRQAPKFPTVYLQALAQAVERLLDRYADAIVELEAKTLRASAVFPMSNLMFELEEFTEILPEVCGLVHRLTMEMQQEQQATCVKGAKLLGVVYQSTSSGFPRVRKCMQELLYSCHRVLFKQMMAWMVHGEIVDPHKEFFVKKVARETTQDVMWHQQFTMDLEAVSLDYFPTSVAESVFVIGKAVHILTRANQFSPREVQDVVKTMSELARRPVFDAVAVEHEVEKLRRHVASRLHQEVVVKSDFVGYLHVLKGFFLLSRGEVFQAFIERSFDIMRLKPTIKSEEDVNYGLWREVVCNLIPEDEVWGRDFDMQLPLQTFALKVFSSSDDLLLFNASRGPNGKYLTMTREGYTPLRDEPGVEKSGSVWWRHAQMDGYSFSSEFTLQWEQKAFWSGSHRASLLLRNEGTLGPATLVNGSFELDDPHTVYVSVDLAIEHLPGNMNGMRVMAQVKPSCGGENGIQSSPVVEVPMMDSNNPVLYVRIQYARQEVTVTASKQIMYKKMLAVVVNDVLMVETQIDLQQVLSLHAARGEYWMGLGFSSLVRLTDWSLDKYSAKTSWREGSGINLKENNTAVTPRELWHALNLRCNVRWPLQLLATSDLLRSYSHLFQFCFRLKRVAHALELAWKSNTLRSKHTTGKGATSAAGALRIRMSFVVRTLELHFQVFVIENKFKKCVEQIESAGDFDRAKRVHETFVAGVVKSCYVHTKTVASALEELLGCCWQFAEYVLQLKDGAELSTDRVALLDQEFHRRFEFLYSVLQISEARDLLFLLDSNGFFAAERERRKQQE